MTDELLPTRRSLLERLKDLGDQGSWNEFYRNYHELIYRVARRAGLNENESEEVVQDTFIAVAKKMPGFTYDPTKDSFKGWLLTVTRWRMRDQFQRRRTLAHQDSHSAATLAEDATRTATIERIPDPAGSVLETIWDEEWEKKLLQVALARVKRRVQPRHYEIYHLHVVLGRRAAQVAQALGVRAAQIYLAKHRVENLIRKEVNKLRAGP